MWRFINIRRNLINTRQRMQHFHIGFGVVEIAGAKNSNCISHAEPVSSSFAVRKRANDIALKCKYCEKEFSHNVVLAN